MSSTTSPSNIYSFEALDASEKPKSLSNYSGQVCLIVNVATKCGYTKKSYDQLAQLVNEHYDKGLRVLLFPCNQFGKQEPGSMEDIQSFACSFNPKFDMFSKINVNGKEAHPLFVYLKSTCPGLITNSIKWNFTKFLIDRNGKPVARYGPNEEPLSFASKVEELLR